MVILNHRRYAALIIALVFPPSFVWSAAGEVHSYRLDNGMRILVQEDHRSPVAAVQLWYRVGSSYEHSGLTGISHVLEHMMFKGTEKNPSDQFSRIMELNGARNNAFTGKDYTSYHQVLASSRLEVSFMLEADRMRNVVFSPEEFTKELEVVKEERRWRIEDQPQSYTYETAYATAFQSSPYRWPIIGWMEDLQRMQMSDVRDWYDRWYGPDNTVLVVVGDVEADEVFALAKDHFGALPAAGVTPPVVAHEPLRPGLRNVQVKREAQVPYLILLYRVPSLPSVHRDKSSEEWEPYALDVLAGILDGGLSSRLQSRLVRGMEVASSIGVGYDLFDRLPTGFVFSGVPAQDHTIEDLKQAIHEEVRQLQNRQITEDELSRVKTQTIAADLYQRDSVFYQALLIGRLETVGLSWEVLREYPKRVREVTADQVMKVASKYLKDDYLTVAELVPQSSQSDPDLPTDNRVH